MKYCPQPLTEHGKTIQVALRLPSIHESVYATRYQTWQNNSSRPPIAKRSRKIVHNPLVNMTKQFKSPIDYQAFAKKCPQPFTKNF